MDLIKTHLAPHGLQNQKIKEIYAALIGISIDRGEIDSLDDIVSKVC